MSEDLTRYVAADAASFLSDSGVLSEPVPADECTDPLAEALGDSITQEVLLGALAVGSELPAKLAQTLSAWFETSAIDERVARALLEFAAVNQFGPDALPR